MPFGKIDTLPAATRDALNKRLEDGQTGSVILPWLNSLPEVKAHLKAEFDGVEISEQNLSNWRNGGYRKWLDRREKNHRARDLAEYARALGKDAADVFAGGAAVAGGILLETLEELDSETQTALIAEKPENLPKLINALARLQDAEGRNRERALKERKHALDERALNLAIEKHQISTAEKLLNKATSKEVQDIVNSSQPKAVKMRQLRLALYGDAAPKPIPVIAE